MYPPKAMYSIIAGVNQTDVAQGTSSAAFGKGIRAAFRQRLYRLRRLVNRIDRLPAMTCSSASVLKSASP